VSLAIAAPMPVCAAPSSDPHCRVDPGTVLKAMDVIIPAACPQADELDSTLHQPVVVQPVGIP
jgi:glucoamylase